MGLLDDIMEELEETEEERLEKEEKKEVKKRMFEYNPQFMKEYGTDKTVDKPQD